MDNIMIRNGKAAFFGTQPAWHKLGQIVDGARSWPDAMGLAGLNWTVSKLALISPLTGKTVESWGIFRDDDQVLLGTVGAQYTPIQNVMAGEFIDAVLSMDHNAHYVSAGALGQGEKIWALAEINGESDITGTGDKHKHYLLFATSHDGSLAATCKLTTVRVVCQNTLTTALNLNGALTRIKHTKSAEERLSMAKNVMTQAHKSVKEIEEKLFELSKRIVNKASFTSVMKRLFGDWERTEGGAVARIESKIAEVARLYEQNDNDQFPEIRGTGYNLLNSITEWTDHCSGVRKTSRRAAMTDDQLRAESSLFGTGEALKNDALEVILEATEGAQRKISTVYMPQSQIVPPGGASSSVDAILNMVDLK